MIITMANENFTDYWKSARTDAPVPFRNLSIERHEIAKKYSEWNHGIPKEVVNAGPFLRYDCYYRAMLVIWPSHHAINFACRYGKSTLS